MEQGALVSTLVVCLLSLGSCAQNLLRDGYYTANPPGYLADQKVISSERGVMVLGTVTVPGRELKYFLGKLTITVSFDGKIFDEKTLCFHSSVMLGGKRRLGFHPPQIEVIFSSIPPKGAVFTTSITLNDPSCPDPTKGYG